MTPSQTDLATLREEFEARRCVPFIGAAGGDTVPAVRQMAQWLAMEIAYTGPELSFPEIAQRFVLFNDKASLIQRLKKWLGDPQLQPTPLHNLLAQLPCTVFFTTAQHTLLERALNNAGRPVTVIAKQEDTAYVDGSRVTVIKLLGDVDRPDLLVLTEKDHLALSDRSPLLLDMVRATLATNTLLFLDYDLSDTELRRLFFQAVRGQGLHKRSAYTIWPNPPEDVRRFWAEENFRFIDDEPVPVLLALQRALAQRRPAEQATAVAAPDAMLPRRPYRFLDAYEQQDAELFAGRELEITLLAQKILAHRLVVLTGASGVGKTSLLRAGVAPRLGQQWRIVFIRPLGDPFATVRDSLLKIADNQPVGTTLAQQINAAEKSTQERLVFVFDQFEELFMHSGEQTCRDFMAQLAPAILDPDSGSRFVISLRDDFFIQLGAFENQIPSILYSVFILRRLEHPQALQAVLGPLAKTGLEIEPGLAEDIVRVLEQQRADNKPGVDPPQLQIVFDQLYEEMLKRGDKRITRADYDRLGGVEQVLPAYLRAVLTRTPKATIVLNTLVGENGAKVQRTLAQIEQQADAEGADVNALVSTLVEARLIRPVPVADVLYYELAHDVLAAALWEWLSQGTQEAARARGILERGLSDWQTGKALLDRQRLGFVAKRWLFLGAVDAQQKTLALRSAVVEDDDIPGWMLRIADPPCAQQVLLELVADPESTIRCRAISYLAEAAPRPSEDEAIVATIQRAALHDPDKTVRKVATFVLYDIQANSSVVLLADQLNRPETTPQNAVLDSLTWLADRGVRLAPYVPMSSRLRVYRRVAFIRLVRHRLQWSRRVIGGTIGGALGMALAILAMFLLLGALTSAVFAAIYGLIFGIIGGLLTGAGIALAAALADRDAPIPRLAGGAVCGALGWAIAWQLLQSSFGLSTTSDLWPAGALSGAVLGAALGLGSIGKQRNLLQIAAGAIGGALGYAAISALTLVPWPLLIGVVAGTLLGGCMGIGLAVADPRSALDTMLPTHRAQRGAQ